ncbi:MAG TPA: hypothetical protein PKO23_14935, partial [Candidatus Hydrogenedentes bacterium]|nr:hypothetical protein [Candidatus Hydrogenedentota bacterium]
TQRHLMPGFSRRTFPGAPERGNSYTCGIMAHLGRYAYYAHKNYSGNDERGEEWVAFLLGGEKQNQKIQS